MSNARAMTSLIILLAAIAATLSFALLAPAYAADLTGGGKAVGIESTGERDSSDSVAADEAAQAEAAMAKAKVESKTRKKAAAEAARKAKLARRTIDDGLYNIGSAAMADYSIEAQSSARAGADRRNRSEWLQKWAVSWDSKLGYYKIRNLRTRFFLGVSSVRAGAALKQYLKAKSQAQLWEPVKTSGGIVFKPAGSELAITATAGKNGVPVFKLQRAKSLASQKYKLRPVEAIEADQTYFIKNVATGTRLNVANNSRAANAQISLANASSATIQKFRLEKSGSGYSLRNVSSCYYVSAQDKNAKVARQVATRSAATKWNVKVDLKAAAFTIGSWHAGKYLDCSTGNLRLSKASDGNGQRFVFSKTYAFKLYLNPGHGWNSNGNGVVDPGATGNGHTEAEFSHDLARRVEGLLAGTDVKVVNGERYGLAFWRRMPKAVSLGCDAIVSIHFDAGGNSGTLGMVGVQGKAPGSDTLSSIIRSSVVKSLGLPDRGPVSRSDITCVNGPIPSMLVEVCFMDNYHDVQTYLGKRDAVARGLADGILKATRNRDVVR